VWDNLSTAVFGANNEAAGTVTIDDTTGTVSAAGVTFNAAGSGNYTIAGSASDTLTLTAPTITVAAGLSPTISAPVVGTSGLTLVGADASPTLTLSGNNNYSGTTQVSAGTLTVASGGNLGVAANALLFGNAGGTIATSANAILNSGVTVASFNDTTESTGVTTTGALVIASGQTATVSGTFTVGVVQSNLATNTNQTLTSYTGAFNSANNGTGGELDVNGAMTVGANPGGANKFTATIDFTAYSTFKLNAPATTLNIGNGLNIAGVVSLASGANSANTINVATISLGTSGSSNAQTGSKLNLGSGSNAIEASTINVGTGKSSGAIQFGSSSGSVTIAGTGGSGTSNITIGNQTSGTATSSTSSLLLAGHSATVQAGTLLVGQGNGDTAGTANASVTFDTGTFNVSTLNIGFVLGSSTQPGGATGAVTVGGASPNNTATGVFNVGSVSSAGTFVLGKDTNTNASPGTATATFTINGGTANVFGTNITNASTKGTTVSTLNLSSGLLDMHGNSIGGAVVNSGNGPIAVNFPATSNTATLANLAGGGINAAGLNMNTAGKLILAGTDTYSNNTSVSNGILQLDGAYTGTGTFNVTGGTLQGKGSTVGAVSISSAAFLAPGDSINTIGVGSASLAGTLNIELNDADSNIVDLLNDSGNLDISAGTSAVTFSVTGTPGGSAYVFAKYGSLTGTAFGTVNNLPTGYQINYSYNDGVSSNNIALVPVPEPAALVLAAVGGLSLMVCRRKKSAARA
jgi:autotransporter-associated beta strand protein